MCNMPYSANGAAAPGPLKNFNNGPLEQDIALFFYSNTMTVAPLSDNFLF